MDATLAMTEQSRPPSLVESFDSVWLLDTELSAAQWRYLWTRFGTQDLIDIGRRSGWFDIDSNRDAVNEMLDRSRRAGFDPLLCGLSLDMPVKEV